MNIRTIIAFSFLMSLFSGSVQAMLSNDVVLAMQDLTDDAIQAMRQMANPSNVSDTDKALKKKFNAKTIDKNRIILEWKTNVFDKVSNGRFEVVKTYLENFGDPNKRKNIAKLLCAAGFGEKFINKVEEAIGETVWLLEGTIPIKSVAAVPKKEKPKNQPKGSTKKDQKIKNQTKPKSFLKRSIRYVVPAVVCSAGIVVGAVVIRHFLKSPPHCQYQKLANL